MTPCSDRRRAPGLLVGLLMLSLLGPPAAARAAYGSVTAGHLPATARRAPAVAGYPAAASRPQIHPRASELARSAPARRASSLGAAVAPSPPRRSSAKTRRPVLRGNPARALVAFQAMQKAYLLKHSYLYAGEPFSYLWPFSQAFAATVSMADVPHLGVSLSHELLARVAGLNAYLDPDNSQAPEGTYVSTLPAFDGAVAPPVGPGGPKYYDDNDWVGIELVRVYKLTHIASVLGSAEGIMAFEMAGWQTSPELGCPGGIPFANTTVNTERNTVTTAPAAELATQLYRITGNAQYLQFAEMAYEWVRRCLLEPSGLYADHIDRQGGGRTAAVELQPGDDDRRRDPALPGDRQLGLPVSGPSDRQGGARLLHAGKARLGNPVLPLDLLPQPAVPRLGHARSAGAEGRPGLCQRRVGAPAPARQPVRRRLAPLCPAARAGGDRADLCAPVLAPQHLFLKRRARNGPRTGGRNGARTPVYGHPGREGRAHRLPIAIPRPCSGHNYSESWCSTRAM